MATRPGQPLTQAEAEIVAGLDSLFRPLALAHRQAVLRRGVPFTFISGYRPYGYQQVVYEQNVTAGRPAAKPGSSKHEIGFAYDADGPTTSAQWAIFGAEAEKLRLEWGGRYSKPDLQHIEARDERSSLASYRYIKMAGILALIVAGVAVASREG